MLNPGGYIELAEVCHSWSCSVTKFAFYCDLLMCHYFLEHRRFLLCRWTCKMWLIWDRISPSCKTQVCDHRSQKNSVNSLYKCIWPLFCTFVATKTLESRGIPKKNSRWITRTPIKSWFHWLSIRHQTHTNEPQWKSRRIILVKFPSCVPAM